MVVANVNGSLWQSGMHRRLQQLVLSAVKKDVGNKQRGERKKTVK